MFPPPALFRIGVAGALLGLAGCATGATVDERPARSVARSTVATPAPAAAPADVYTTALERAQNGAVDEAARDVAGIQDWAERNRTAARITSALAETSMERAGSFAEALPADRSQAAAIEAAAQAMQRRDESSALNWAMRLRDSANRAAALRVIAAQSAAVNPERAIERIQSLPAGPAREEALHTAAASWVRNDANAAMAWLRGQPEGPHKTGLTASMGFELAQKDPKAAIALCEAMPAGRDRRLIWLRAAQTWAAQDHAAATKWAEQLPSGEARQLALQAFNDMGVGDGVSGAGVRRRFR